MMEQLFARIGSNSHYGEVWVSAVGRDKAAGRSRRALAGNAAPFDLAQDRLRHLEKTN